MNRNIIALLLILFCNVIIAQNDTIMMSELEVSAYRTPTLYSESSRIIEVITREEIRESPAGSIAELLEYSLNADIRQRGYDGVQADVSIRGGSFEQVLILLNGIPWNDPQTGHHNMDIPVDLRSVDRIEILEGPGSRVYGPNAFSGAINIITDEAGNNKVRLAAGGGQHGLYDASVAGSFRNKNMSHYLSVGKKASDGYIKNTDFDMMNFFLGSSYETDGITFSLQAGYLDKAFGANSFYTPKYPDQFETTKTKFVSIKAESKGKLNITPYAYWKRHNDKFELFRYEAADWYKGPNYHMTDVLGGGVNMQFHTGLGRTAFGADFHNDDIKSNVLGKEVDNPKPVHGGDGAEYTRAASRQNLSIFAEHSVFYKQFSASAGMMVNWNSDFDWAVYPGVDFSYKLAKSWRIYGSVNQSLRLPTYTDLYYVGPTNIGNSELLPEKSLTFETGFKYGTKSLNGHVGVFRRYGTNIIDWVRTSDTLKWESKNITELTATGIELSLNLSGKALGKNHHFIKYLRLNYAFMSVEKESAQYISKYALDYLKNKLSLGIQHKVYRNVGASWLMTWQDRAGTWSNFESGMEEDYKPFFLVDFRMFWEVGRFNIYADVTNLLDTEYYDFGNIVMPGRWIRGGIVFELEY